VVLGNSHFLHGVNHDLGIFPKGTIGLLLLKQMAQSSSYPARMLVIPMLSQQTECLSGALEPAPVKPLPLQQFL